MSLQALLGSLATLIDEARTLEELKHVLSSGFSSAAPIDVRTPIRLTNHTNGNVLQVVNTGRDDWHGLSIQDAAGRETTIGIGLASAGLVANEVIPDRNFSLDPDAVTAHYNGVTVGSGYGPQQGFFQKLTGIVKGGWGRFFDSYFQSLTTWHPPATADQFSMNGNRKWMPCDPVGWTVLRCCVTAVNNDTLTCVVIDDGSGNDPAGIIGSTITVAKDCHLQRTPWDGLTIGGVTYTYSDSQTRTATSGSGAETQVVYPKYRVEGDSYDPCSCIYARWAANRTDVSGVWYIDLNTAARHWVVA